MKEGDKKACDISFKPTSNGGCGGQKDLQSAFLGDRCPNPSEKFADQNNNCSIENSLGNRDGHAKRGREGLFSYEGHKQRLGPYVDSKFGSVSKSANQVQVKVNGSSAVGFHQSNSAKYTQKVKGNKNSITSFGYVDSYAKIFLSDARR